MGRRAALALLVSGSMVAAALVGVQVGHVRASSHQEVVYIATGENFPDALGAGPVAALANGPVLLVTKDSIPGATLTELNRLQPSTIVIVGGSGVVSSTVFEALEGLSFNPSVERVAGADRFATAAEISKSRFPATLDADTLDGIDSSGFVKPTDLLVAHASGNQFEVISTDETVRSVTINAPVAGVVVANSAATATEDTAGDEVQCSLTTGTAVDGTHIQWFESGGIDAGGGKGSLAGTRGFDVAAGPTTINLVCQHVGVGSSVIQDSAITAIFIPAP